MSHSGSGDTTPQGPQGYQGPDFGAHTQAQGTASHSATTSTTTHGSGGPSTRSRRNQGAGPSPRTNAAPYTVPSRSRSRFASVGPEPPSTPSAPSAPSAPEAPAGYHRTDGTDAWDGYSPAAAAPQGVSAARATTNHFAPSLFPSTTTPSWPVAGTGGLSEQLNILQRAYPLYQGFQPAGVFTHDTGSASAPSSQYPPQSIPSLDALNQTHQPPFHSVFTPPLGVPDQGDPAQLCICKGDHWLTWCNRFWDHYNFAMLELKCTCPPESLKNGEVPKDCPIAFHHLLTLMPDNIALPPIQLPEALSAPSTRTTHLPFTPLLTHEASPPTQDICQPSNVSQNLDLFDSHHAPLGGGSYSVPVLQSLPVGPLDTVTLSSPSCRGTPRNRRKASRTAGNLPAKRSRRGPQPKVTGNTGTKVDPENASLGFESLDDKPEIQKAMRALFALLLKQKFVKNNTDEPVLGDPKADELLAKAVASDGSSEANALPRDEIWNGYVTRGRSIYSVFIQDGWKCRLCGNEQQKDKPLRGLRHFRAKHMKHKPFHCEDTHDGTKCNARFACNEAMAAHKKEKVDPKAKVKFRCQGCGNEYTTTTSNQMRHLRECKKLLALTGGASHSSAPRSHPESSGAVAGEGIYEYGYDDDEYGHDGDEYGHDGDEYGHDDDEYGHDVGNDGDDGDDGDGGHDDDLYC